MGLMDKVRAQATQLAQKTQEAAQEGKARYDQAQANRRGDALLRQLGAVVYADRTGRGTSDSQSKMDKLIGDISSHERENGLNLSQTTVPAQGDGQTGGTAPPGSFTGPEHDSPQPGQESGTQYEHSTSYSYPAPSGEPGPAPQSGDQGTTQYDAPYTDRPQEPDQSGVYFAPQDDGQPGWDRPGQYPGS